MRRKRLQKILVLALSVAMFAGAGVVSPTRASDQITSVSNQLDNLKENTDSGHLVHMVMPNGVGAGSGIVVIITGTFTVGSSYDYTDMAFAVGSTGNCSTASFTSKTLAATPAGTTWGAAYSFIGYHTFNFTSDTDTIPAGRCVRVDLNSNGTNHNLTNPDVVGNTSYPYFVIEATTEDAGAGAIMIVEDTTNTPDGDQIQIDAQVDFALSFDVDVSGSNCNNNTETTSSQNRVNLDSLTPGIVRKSNAGVPFICIDFVTNSANGGSIFVRSARANAVGGLVRIGTSTAIASATADLNSGGVTEGFGIRVVDTGTPTTGSFTISSPFNSSTSGSVGLIPGTSASADDIVTATAPVQTGSSDRIEVEVAAKAGVNTVAGIYTDILTFTATANF